MDGSEGQRTGGVEAVFRVQKVSAIGEAAVRCLAWPNPSSGRGLCDWVVTGDLGYSWKEDSGGVPAM